MQLRHDLWLETTGDYGPSGVACQPAGSGGCSATRIGAVRSALNGVDDCAPKYQMSNGLCVGAYDGHYGLGRYARTTVASEVMGKRIRPQLQREGIEEGRPNVLGLCAVAQRRSWTLDRVMCCCCCCYCGPSRCDSCGCW